MNVGGEVASAFQNQDTIREVGRDREDLARVLKKHAGIRKIVEDLYPDSAHFIYELLQNAEDTGATEANFILSGNGLVFEHNGRPFEKKDIEGITDIGEGTKAEEVDKIGRFGVGFKAVFAYSETPHIWSPTYSFKIEELVLPSAIASKRDIGERTRFEFPFNNPKKPAERAYKDVEEGLRGLAETALLFLSHLQCIRWRTGEGESGQIMRIQHSNHHVEVLKESSINTNSSSHFLKFDQPVPGLEKQRVAVAFSLDFLPNVKGFNAKEPLAQQFRIADAPGSVAVYFPAEKESSGLRFHLHAPFVPELSRASIKETPANQPLFDQLAELIAASLHKIRDIGLLTVEFLAVLPNRQEPIPPRYEGIRKSVIRAMNTEPLTPTHDKSHAPARYLLQAKAPLKNLLSEKDIEYLVEHDDEPPRWAVGVTQKYTNIDHFLGSLDIRGWGVEEFVKLLVRRSSDGTRYIPSPPYWVNGPGSEFLEWLASKPVEWHQRLYALLYGELAPEGQLYRLKTCRIIPLSDGSYSIGSKCFFPDEGSRDDKVLPRVAEFVYSSGKNKTQQDQARKFLEEIGVRVVGEAEQVEFILRRRYTKEAEIPDEKTYLDDLKRFIALVEKDTKCAKLFEGYYIFECEGDQWSTPEGVYIDEPFRDTGLRAYYEAQGDKAELFPLAARYIGVSVAPKRLAAFAEATGAQSALDPSPTKTEHHPQRRKLLADWYYGGARWTGSAIDRDWTIPGLSEALAHGSVRLSSLVWRTMCAAAPEVLVARYRPNQQYSTTEAPSSLILLLQNAEWIPQGDGAFVRPSQASRDLLPPGFPFDSGQAWLKAVKWGEEVVKRSEQQRQKEIAARELGFADQGSLERARRFAALPPEDQERILADREPMTPIEFPDNTPSNPARRAERVAAQAVGAPDRETEERTRSVSVGLQAVKEKADQYLRQQYTSDGHMICQLCKRPMPFKRNDGSDYFEKVEFLPELKKRHYQNYLALCPNHAAMFKEVNGSADFMLDLFSKLSGNELEVVLAQENTTIYFRRTHIADLKQVIKSDQQALNTEAEIQDDAQPCMSA